MTTAAAKVQKVTQIRTDPLTVFAPASIGNVSVGFDALGLALAPVDGSLLGDTVQLREAFANLVDNPGDQRPHPEHDAPAAATTGICGFTDHLHTSFRKTAKKISCCNAAASINRRWHCAISR